MNHKVLLFQVCQILHYKKQKSHERFLNKYLLINQNLLVKTRLKIIAPIPSNKKVPFIICLTSLTPPANFKELTLSSIKPLCLKANFFLKISG